MFGALILSLIEHAAAQTPGRNAGPLAQHAALPAGPSAVVPQPLPSPRQSQAARGPLARLVQNPDSSHGLPPFALTDQTGAIQRYVEPLPGINLAPYVGQVVTVRHDTGHTLLASQLELPPLPMVPLLGEATGSAPPSRTHNSPGANLLPLLSSATVKPAQYVDDDDSTVQLLPDGEEIPFGERSAIINEMSPPTDASAMAPTEEELPALPHYSPPGNPGDMSPGPMLSSPMGTAPDVLNAYPADVYGMEVCPDCGGYHLAPDCPPEFGMGYGPAFESKPSKPCSLFADVEINFLRTHVTHPAGKLSEKYEFSPRVIVGFSDTEKLDGRVRYWNYGRDTRLLAGNAIRVDFDVLDLEGTHVFVGRRGHITLGAGFRLAGIDLIDIDGEIAGSDLIGMTLSAEGRAPLCVVRRGRISGVYGGRLSLLGGDWGGHPDNDFVGGLVQDDNVVVHELHAGFDYAFRYRDLDLHARLGVEMQNWHSDVLSQNAGADSIGFIGPGLQIGAEF